MPSLYPVKESIKMYQPSRLLKITKIITEEEVVIEIIDLKKDNSFKAVISKIAIIDLEKVLCSDYKA